MPHAEARSLRIALLHRSDAADAATSSEPVAGAATPDDVPSATAEDVVLLRFDPRWVRYAPLTTSGNVIAAGLLALLGQFSEQLSPDWLTDEEIRSIAERLSLAGVIPAVLVAFLVLGAVFSVLGYYVANWGFQLARDARGRTFHVRRGLLTTTETSLERERVRGLSVDEPLGLRLANAGRLAAIVTGVSKSEAGRTQLVPPAPRRVIAETGAQVLEQPEAAARAARPARPGRPSPPLDPGDGRRGWSSRWWPSCSPPRLPLPWWVVLPTLITIPLAAFLAFDRYRRLGHALTDEYLVVRSGSLRGRRDIVQRTGIIGWNLQQSWFQRRAGLVTLVATTAAGTQAYAAIDVPEATAIALADEAVPGLVDAVPRLRNRTPALNRSASGRVQRGAMRLVSPITEPIPNLARLRRHEPQGVQVARPASGA